jgi:hypothetical protein
MSRKLYGLLAAGILMTVTGGTVLAQDKGGGGDVQYKSKTVYDFDDDTVEGDLVRPDGEFVDTRKGAKHSSLIKIRENFIPEMIKSAEDI